MASPHVHDPIVEAKLVGLLAGRVAGGYPSPPHSQRQRTARHEAAHAVSAWLCGQRIKLVTIRATSDTSGCLEYEPSGTFSAAAREFVDAAVSRRRNTDLRTALFCLALDKGATWRSMRAEARRLQQKARQFVVTEWPLIRALAEELLVRSTLTGDQVVEFLEGEVAARERRQRRWQRQRQGR